MSARLLGNKQLMCGIGILLCIILSVLIMQPGSIMLAQSARPAPRTTDLSSISLKTLQSGVAQHIDAAEASTIRAQAITPMPSPIVTAPPVPSPTSAADIGAFPTVLAMTPTPVIPVETTIAHPTATAAPTSGTATVTATATATLVTPSASPSGLLTSPSPIVTPMPTPEQ